MKILGIIAEYDPFHSGHLHHMTEAVRRTSPDLVFVALSPCFKQRGELPLLSPSDRARLALEGGADAVFSLPGHGEHLQRARQPFFTSSGWSVPGR